MKEILIQWIFMQLHVLKDDQENQMFRKQLNMMREQLNLEVVLEC
jgi:hypothetical protein